MVKVKQNTWTADWCFTFDGSHTAQGVSADIYGKSAKVEISNKNGMCTTVADMKICHWAFHN